MSKKLLAIFLLLGVLTYAEDNDTSVIINNDTQKATDNEEVITTEITRQVIGENNQQLDVKEIDTEELILQNQNLESSSINITILLLLLLQLQLIFLLLLQLLLLVQLL